MSQLLGHVGKIYVVNGAPGSGKSTYVQTYKKFSDVVLDVDYFCQCLTGSDNLYRTNKISYALGSMIYDFIVSKSFEIICSGRNLWIIMAEADEETVNKFVSRLNATLIEIPSDVELCKYNIESDDRRKWKQYYYNKVDQWFEIREHGKTNQTGLTDDELLKFYNMFSCILNGLNVNYYVTGSISAILNYNVNFGRRHDDIDLYVDNKDILKLKTYCDANGWKFLSLYDTSDILSKYGHVCCLMPFENKSFHVGLFPFIPNNGMFSHYSFFVRYEQLHALCLDFDDKSTICSYLQNCPHILPYEYAMIFKLEHARRKDFDDFNLVKSYLDFDLFKSIKDDFKNSDYKLFLFNDRQPNIVESGKFEQYPDL